MESAQVLWQIRSHSDMSPIYTVCSKPGPAPVCSAWGGKAVSNTCFIPTRIKSPQTLAQHMLGIYRHFLVGRAIATAENYSLAASVFSKKGKR